MTSSAKSQEKSVGLYWLITLLSMVGIVLFLIFKPEWFWVMLPPFFTFFVKSMKWM